LLYILFLVGENTTLSLYFLGLKGGVDGNEDDIALEKFAISNSTSYFCLILATFGPWVSR
jgi:hypothetical protein